MASNSDEGGTTIKPAVKTQDQACQFDSSLLEGTVLHYNVLATEYSEIFLQISSLTCVLPLHIALQILRQCVTRVHQFQGKHFIKFLFSSTFTVELVSASDATNFANAFVAILYVNWQGIVQEKLHFYIFETNY